MSVAPVDGDEGPQSVWDTAEPAAAPEVDLGGSNLWAGCAPEVKEVEEVSQEDLWKNWSPGLTTCC